MKKILLRIILFCIMLPSSLMAQKLEEVVYLKNGNILRGVIIEQIPNKSITIKINENNKLLIQFDEIEKITKEEIAKKEKKPQALQYKNKGYINLTEVNLGYGIRSIEIRNNGLRIYEEENNYGLRTVNGYQFSPFFTLGMGLGYERISYSGFIPVTIDSRIMFTKNKISPVLNLNGGYAVGVNNSGGFCLNPAAGVRLYLSQNIALLVNMGYKLQQVTFTSRNFSFLTISAGVSF